MRNIKIEIVRTDDISNMLCPNYDFEADLLTISNINQEEWSYGIDIDGKIVFDFNSNYTLSSFDVLIPKKLWEVVSDFEILEPMYNGKLKISEESIKIKSFHLPVKVHTNEDKTLVKVLFGGSEKWNSIVKLSEKCYTLVYSSILKGFFIKL